nr:hypothetical protein KXZ65_11345 [Pectobacterium sp. PL152]
MHNNTVNWLHFLPLLLAAAPQAYSAETASPEQFLMEQVRLGEASNKDDLVRQSLYRLELIDPNNPEVIAARVRLALRQGDQAQARQQLDKLKTVAPDSATYRQSAIMLALTQDAARQQLQQARLLSTAGRYAEAKTQYDALFHGEPPTIDLAVEYWRLVSRLPDQQPLAIKQLEALDQVYRIMFRCAWCWHGCCLARTAMSKPIPSSNSFLMTPSDVVRQRHSGWKLLAGCWSRHKAWLN